MSANLRQGRYEINRSHDAEHVQSFIHLVVFQQMVCRIRNSCAVSFPRPQVFKHICKSNSSSCEPRDGSFKEALWGLSGSRERS